VQPIKLETKTTHFARAFANKGPICRRPEADLGSDVYEYVTDPKAVTCKACVKQLPRYGVAVDAKVRKLTPSHLGSLSAEERAAQDERVGIKIRDLREMLALTAIGENPEAVTEVIKTVKHWLMDAEHDRRLKNELDEQAVITRLINLL
jgi:hypothetical protein